MRRKFITVKLFFISIHSLTTRSSSFSLTPLPHTQPLFLTLKPSPAKLLSLHRDGFPRVIAGSKIGTKPRLESALTEIKDRIICELNITLVCYNL